MRSAPLRRENLSELRVGTDPEKNLGPNIYIPREPGRQGWVHLWAGEIKMGSRDFEFWLTPLATRLIRRSEEHTSELQSLMRISYAALCLKKKNRQLHYYNQRLHSIRINH